MIVDIPQTEFAHFPLQVHRADALVIVGGTGDLSMRMLLPSLYRLEGASLLPEDFTIIGTARQRMEREVFIALVREGVSKRLAPETLDPTQWNRFAARIDYFPLDAGAVTEIAALGEQLAKKSIEAPLFYLSTSPSLFSPICEALRSTGVAGSNARLLIEKPIGHNLASSRQINDGVSATFTEDRVYRVDHYLGKESVQNLFAIRFANSLFEPLWNKSAIDSVQITIAETAGVGERWHYYDRYGAIRDMLQNHLLQLLCLVAMEPPSDLSADAIRDEKVKVLKALRPLGNHSAAQNTVLGQYTAGFISDEECAAYATEKGAPSNTETYVAIRAEVDNWRWAGVPFFLRTGKRLPERRTRIVVQFKPVSHWIFPERAGNAIAGNQLIIDLQPNEEIRLVLLNAPSGLWGNPMNLTPLPLTLRLGGAAYGQRRIAYERLLLDAINGNPTLYVRRDEVEQAWRWVDAIAATRFDHAAVEPYAAGTWGPSSATDLIERSGHKWA